MCVDLDVKSYPKFWFLLSVVMWMETDWSYIVVGQFVCALFM